MSPSVFSASSVGLIILFVCVVFCDKCSGSLDHVEAACKVYAPAETIIALYWPSNKVLVRRTGPSYLPLVFLHLFRWMRLLLRHMYIIKTALKQMKKRSERRKHCALAVVTRSQKISPRRRPPSRGRRTAKI